MRAETAAHTGRPPLALLIDRDADTRQMYAEFLRATSCEIEEAEDGREGLVKALTRHPDIIVTETRLAGINGFELCRLLRLDSVTHDIPIVVVTGDAFDADVKRAQAAGADAVLIKPCLPDALASEIRRALEQSRVLRARGRARGEKISGQLERAEELIDRSRATRARRAILSRAHHRHDTTAPPITPPTRVCPSCDQPLTYLKSHIGGVSERHQEQWDYYECAGGCGTYQYRQRTRKLRRVI